jgi:hypothetical protein
MGKYYSSMTLLINSVNVRFINISHASFSAATTCLYLSSRYYSLSLLSSSSSSLSSTSL